MPHFWSLYFHLWWLYAFAHKESINFIDFVWQRRKREERGCLLCILVNFLWQQQTVWTKATLGSKEFIWLTCSLWDNSEPKLKAGTWGRYWSRGQGRSCLMNSPWFVGPIFSFNPGLLAQGRQCPQWAGPSHMNHQSRKWLTEVLIGQSDGDKSLTEIPSSQLSLGLCQVDMWLTTSGQNVKSAWETLKFSRIPLFLRWHKVK